jgi:hypothetical protein
LYSFPEEVFSNNKTRINTGQNACQTYQCQVCFLTEAGKKEVFNAKSRRRAIRIVSIVVFLCVLIGSARDFQPGFPAKTHAASRRGGESAEENTGIRERSVMG